MQTGIFIAVVSAFLLGVFVGDLVGRRRARRRFKATDYADSADPGWWAGDIGYRYRVAGEGDSGFRIQDSGFTIANS